MMRSDLRTASALVELMVRHSAYIPPRDGCVSDGYHDFGYVWSPVVSFCILHEALIRHLGERARCNLPNILDIIDILQHLSRLEERRLIGEDTFRIFSEISREPRAKSKKFFLYPDISDFPCSSSSIMTPGTILLTSEQPSDDDNKFITS
jgi:hypothetical protein